VRYSLWPRDEHRSATTAEKLRGDQGLGPNTGALVPGRLCPAPGQRPGWVLGAGGGSLSRCDGPGYHPRKIFVNSDAKSCILVTTFCEISCFLKTMAKKLGGGGGGQYVVGPPS